MSSYFSSLLTQTTSRVASIRQNIFTSEADGDTEDDTHLCRVLRAYYTEKGRPFPGWLPPDPKAPLPAVQPVYSNSNIGAGYGGLNNPPQGAGLSSLWDSQPAGGIVQQDPQSLRRGRGTPGMVMSRAGAGRDHHNRSQTQSTEPPVQARPLPSQRAGSHQTAGVYGGRGDGAGTPPASAGTGSASDKLKARLWGGARSASPTLANTAVAAQAQYKAGTFDRGNNYGGPGSGGPGGGSYEDRFAPGNNPPAGSSAPWASNWSEYGGGGGDGPSRQQPSGRTGLPSGPRSGGSLPSGPRSMR